VIQGEKLGKLNICMC